MWNPCNSVVTALLLLATALPAGGQAPPPMFSPWYGEALRSVMQLEPEDVIRLERQIAANPADFPARLQLMAYHQRGDRAGRAEDRAKRAEHALWLIENHPASELLHSPVSRFARSELSDAAYRRAVELWDRAAALHRSNAAVQWNAATFFEDLDTARHLHYLEATAAADPNHPWALRPLAGLYARLVLQRGPLTARAAAGLDSSNNVWVLGNAAHTLQHLYNQSLQAGAPQARAKELAERYFERAKKINPALDRNTILPQIDLQAVARVQESEQQAQAKMAALADEAVRRLRRLPVEAFPQLPAAVAGVLRARQCTVPQTTADGPARNVVRGEFHEKGRSGWAVLCSVNGSTDLLVFRDDRDTAPQLLNTSEDRAYFQMLDRDRVAYSREITAVGREFIMGHYRAYGGPEPPPIDHQGIDDAFLEKASVTWYYHRGKWLQLQGAD